MVYLAMQIVAMNDTAREILRFFHPRHSLASNEKSSRSW